MSPGTPLSTRLVKPTTRTKFRIDFEWWEREEQAYRVSLMSHLCPTHQAAFADQPEGSGELIDVVDPETAEVQRLDGLQYVLRTHCTQQPDYLTQRTTLVDAVFRVFMANGNQPLTPEELAERIGRPGQAQSILRTLAGHVVYKGMRPVQE